MEVAGLRDLADGLPLTEDELDGDIRPYAADGEKAPWVPGWFGVLQSEEEVASEGIRWVYRKIQLTGTIRTEEPGVDPRTPIALRLFASSTLPGSSASPATEFWLRGHGLRRWPLYLGPPDQKGAVCLAIPRIAGLYLSVDGGGYRPQAFPVPTTGDTWNLDIVLRRGRRVAGVLRGPDGSPMAGQQVRVFVVRRGNYEDWGPNIALLKPDGGIAGSRHEGLDASVCWMSAGTRTGEDGSFSLTLKGDGEVHIFAYPEHLSLVEARLGLLDADREDLELVATPPSGSEWVSVRFGGRPVAGRDLMIIDLSGVPQVSFHVTSDEAGRIPGGWIVAGRIYQVNAGDIEDLGGGGNETRWGTWGGEDRIDLADWSRKPPNIRLLDRK